ncbi:putative holin-like toxin [Scopulibacillus cellulosilyticus]|uniref:Holin-like toxin n=1 Tax=Scopulibacillus cellulosilyticus TaxID=2665665 RepID=A0ABW2PXF9_9BACL
MTAYQVITLMISFGSLIVVIMNSKKK